jgi:hypothetical protein
MTFGGTPVKIDPADDVPACANESGDDTRLADASQIFAARSVKVDFHNQLDVCQGSVMTEEHLTKELETFRRHQEKLEAADMGRFVVIVGDDIVDTFATFDEAAREAITRFGPDTTYLIRKIGSYSASSSIAALL